MSTRIKKSKIEFAFVKGDEIKEKPNLDLGVNLFSQPREIDTGMSLQLLLLHSLWKAISQITFVVLTSMYEQIFKAYLVCLYFM